MVLTIWDIFHYLYKRKVLIIITLCICVVLSQLYVYRSKSYSAEVIIEYGGSKIEQGQSPDGEALDVYEIVSPNVIAKALDDLNLKANVDTIRSSVTITPIIPEDVATIKKSKEKEGEEYTYYPKQYSVKFVDKSGNKYGSYARDVLDAIIKNYTAYYSETHVTQSSLSNIDNDIKVGSHDYIEIAEIIEDNATSFIKYLDDQIETNPTFRSSKTGLSFSDLSQSFSDLKQFDLPTLFSRILKNQVTQNKEILLKKYAQRKDELLLQKANRNEKATLTSNLMDRFVESNRKVANSVNNGNNPNNGTNQIASTDIVTSTKLGQEKTTYDNLIDKYVKTGIEGLTAQIDADYCDTIISQFNAAATQPVNTTAQKKQVETEITTLGEKWDHLYQLATTTLDDYNATVASQYITWLSGVSIESTISQKLYMAVGGVLGLGLGCLIAIALEVSKELKRQRKCAIEDALDVEEKPEEKENKKDDKENLKEEETAAKDEKEDNENPIA